MNGKGDKPRNCFSSDFKSNYDETNLLKRYAVYLEDDSGERSVQMVKARSLREARAQIDRRFMIVDIHLW